MLQTQPFPVSDFSGGLNENAAQCAPNQFVKADNFIVSDQKGLWSRDGSVLYDSASPALITGQRVDNFFSGENQETLFGAASQKLFSYTTSWTELTGPSGYSAFAEVTGNGRPQFAEWKKHIFIVNEGNCAPVKVYRDSAGVLQIRTAGLPAIPNTNFQMLQECISVSNSLRSDMISHFANNGGGSGLHYVADSVSTALISASACTDLTTMLALTGQLLLAYASHSTDAASFTRNTVVTLGQRTYHSAQYDAGITALYPYNLISVVTPTTLLEARDRLTDLSHKFVRHRCTSNIHYLGGSATAYAYPDISSCPNVVASWQNAYDLCNDISTKFTTHMAASGGAGHSAAVASATLLSTYASAATKLTLAQLLWITLWLYTTHVTDALLASPSYHGETGTTSALLASSLWFYAVGNTFAGSNYYEQQFQTAILMQDFDRVVTILNALQTAYNSHDADTGTGAGPYTHTNASASQSVLSAISSANYIYHFLNHYTYTVGPLTYEDFGPTTLIEPSTGATADISQVAISNLPVLSNNGFLNYDTTNIKVYIYRTTSNGTTAYLAGTLTNGTTTFADTISDANLVATAQTIYTAGDVLDNDPPPTSKFIVIIGESIGYYGNIRSLTETQPNRIRQSNANDIDSCPSGNYLDLPEENTGLSAARNIPIAWTKHSTYRIEGQFDETGQGSMVAVAISDVIGMVASYSPVQVGDGVVFAGTDGFYFTDGYQITLLSNNWRKTYLALVSSDTRARNIIGAYDRLGRKVWYGVSENAAQNDKCYTLDLNWGYRADACWTTSSNGSSFAPTALGYFKNQLIRGDSRGYVFKHDSNFFTDPLVDTSVTPSSWRTKTIIWDYQGPAFNFGEDMLRKWIPTMYLKAYNASNVSIQINSINDLGKTIGALAPIRFHDNLEWGDPSIVWGTTTTVFDPKYFIDEKRRFPSGYLRCSNKQVEITNAQTVILNSDTYGTATTSATVAGHFNVTLNTVVAGQIWPPARDLLDWYIQVPSDTSTTLFPISARTSDSILVAVDSGSVGPGVLTTAKWQLVGIPKNERLKLISYTLLVALLGDTEHDATGETGKNA